MKKCKIKTELETFLKNENVLDQFIKNSNLPNGETINTIEEAFLWRESPEGAHFWYLLGEKFRNSNNVMKTPKKIDISERVIFNWLYPVYAKEFLLIDSYEEFAKIVQKDFDLTSEQWEALLHEWESIHNQMS